MLWVPLSYAFYITLPSEPVSKITDTAEAYFAITEIKTDAKNISFPFYQHKT